MHRHLCLVVATALLLLTSLAATQDKPKFPTWIDPAKAAAEDFDFNVQGEYLGDLQSDEGPVTWGVQVIALGDGKFNAAAYRGGLPGEGWEPGDDRREVAGKREGDKALFPGDVVTGTWKDGSIAVTTADDRNLGTLKRVNRTSPSMGRKPPQRAVVLFDGSGVEQFEPGAKMEGDLLTQGARSKYEHGDATIHIEFLLPYMPHARGQQRGNSGMYMQGRYETQMLDSFGLEGKDNECGGIYEISAPRLNACLPPLTWQTYDVDFTAPRFNEQGEKTANAKMTVRLNGILVQENVEVPRPTRAALKGPEAPTGPLMLQNHSNPVRYRNIWLAPK